MLLVFQAVSPQRGCRIAGVVAMLRGLDALLDRIGSKDLVVGFDQEGVVEYFQMAYFFFDYFVCFVGAGFVLGFEAGCVCGLGWVVVNTYPP